MIRIFLPLMLAALGLSAASCSQSEAPFAPSEAPASPQPASHEATRHGTASAAMESPPDSPQASSAQDASTASGSPESSSAESSSPAPSSQPPSTEQDPAPQSDADTNAVASMPAERRASTLIGMPVVVANGNPVGEVKDIIFDRQGRATHVVVGYGTEPDSGPAEIPGDGKPAPGSQGKLTAMPWDAALASIKDGRLVLDGGKLEAAPSFTPDAWPNLDDPDWSAATDAYWRKAVRAAIAAHPGSPIDSTTRQRGRPARDSDGNGN